MRKITNDAINAFYSDCGKGWGRGNTSVTVDDGVVSLNLFGNKIAKRTIGRHDVVEICMAGYGTVTTRERLNGLLGVSLCQRKGEQVLNGEIIDPYEWYIVRYDGLVEF